MTPRAAGGAFQKVPRSFYARPAETVARELLGMQLVRQIGATMRVGKIVETEAYLGPHDQAAHARHGPTKRNASMFGPPGRAYVYLVYGIHECVNVVTGAQGDGTAVLIRALEPVLNCGAANGPGRLTRAMGITRSLDGCDLLGNELFVARATDAAAVRIVRGRRIGVDYAGRWAARLLRFYIRDNPHVSR